MAIGSGTRPAITEVRPALVLVCTCLGLFLGQVDTSAVNLALPAMSRDLAGGISGQQWVVDAYNVAFAALLLTGGTLGDRFGRRLVFRLGLIIFTVGSIACAAAPTLAVVLTGRVLQGVGSAMMLPQSLAILAVTFPERRDRNRAMAAWSAVGGIGLAVGPTVGGLLVSEISWRSIFWVNVPIGLLSLLLSIRNVPESRNENAKRVDLAGQVLGTLTLALVTFVAVDGHQLGWTSPLAVSAMIAVVVCASGFVLVERSSSDPMLPLGLLRRGQLPVATTIAMCVTFGGYAMLVLTSLAFQQQRGATPLVAGLELLPLPVAFTVFSPLAGRIVTRYGPKVPMSAGMVLLFLSLLLYATIGADANLAAIEVVYVAWGVGLAMNTGPVVGVAVASVSSDRAGLASGIVNLARMFGATLGIAVQGTVLAAVSNSVPRGPLFLSGFRTAILVGAFVVAVGVVITFSRVDGTPRQAA